MWATRLAIAIGLLLAVPAAAQITPAITASITSGPSPLAVAFDAENTTHSNSTINTNRFADLVYLWDFGDTGSGTWTPTGNSRNQMTGAISAHVFEPSSFPNCSGTCREYTVTLTVKDASGNSAQTTQLITVYNADATGANGWGDAGESICISRTTDHTGCPSVATQRSNQTGNFQTILSTEINTNGFRRVLFHQGQTWTSTAGYSMATNGPILIGSYGAGKATVAATVTGTFGIGIYSDWRFQDLIFTGDGTDDTLFGVTGASGARNLLVQRTDIPDLSFWSVLTWTIGNLSGVADDDLAPRHIFFVDNTWGRLSLGNSGTQAHMLGWGVYWVGNTLGDTINGSHGIRLEQGRDVLVSNNQMAAQAGGKNILNLRDIPNTCGLCPRPLCGTPTERYIIQYNNFTCETGACIGGTMQTCAGTHPVEDMEQLDYIIEGNLFKPGSATPQDVMGFGNGNNTRYAIRSNILDVTGTTFARPIFVSTGPSVSIYNNTCFRGDVTASGVASCVIPGVNALSCSGNVMYAPNWSNASTISAIYTGGGFSCTTLSQNKHNGTGGGLTANPFTSSTPSTRTDFTPHSTSQLLDLLSSTHLPDNFGLCSASNRDGGAIERGATTCFAAAAKVLNCTNSGPVTDQETFNLTATPSGFVGNTSAYLFDCNDNGTAQGCVTESGVLGTCTGTGCTCTCDALAAGSRTIDCSADESPSTGPYTDSTVVQINASQQSTGTTLQGVGLTGTKAQ